MAALTTQDKAFLADLFGERVTFDKTERKLYGHDIAAMPSMVKPRHRRHHAGRGRPADDRGAARRLMQWADDQRVAAHAARQGHLGLRRRHPRQERRRRRLLLHEGRPRRRRAGRRPSPSQPGITWEQLDRALKPHGLTLRLYPTSYPSSTVGGWLAQGGAGIGSYELRLLRRQRRQRPRRCCRAARSATFAGDDLALLADAEGITGVHQRGDAQGACRSRSRVRLASAAPTRTTCSAHRGRSTPPTCPSGR